MDSRRGLNDDWEFPNGLRSLPPNKGQRNTMGVAQLGIATVPSFLRIRTPPPPLLVPRTSTTAAAAAARRIPFPSHEPPTRRRARMALCTGFEGSCCEYHEQASERARERKRTFFIRVGSEGWISFSATHAAGGRSGVAGDKGEGTDPTRREARATIARAVNLRLGSAIAFRGGERNAREEHDRLPLIPPQRRTSRSRRSRRTRLGRARSARRK